MTRIVAAIGAALLLTLPSVLIGEAAGAQEASTWVSQPSGTNERLSAAMFTDATHGHVVGAAGTILATNDGGQHWVQQWACVKSNPCNESSKDRVSADLSGVTFAETGSGYIVGAGGVILATVDGGRTWSVQVACSRSEPCQGSSKDRIIADLASVSFYSPTEGYAVGAKGTILATVDGGKRWVRQNFCNPGDYACEHPLTFDLTSVSSVGPSESYAVGVRQDGTWTILINSGDGWLDHNVGEQRVLVFNKVPLASTSFTPSYGGAGGQSATHGHAVGKVGTIINTIAGGEAWGIQESGTTADLTGVAFSDDLNGRVVGRAGTVLATSDGGQSWLPQSSGTTVDLSAVSVPDANDAYAVGAGGVILKSHQDPPPGLVVRGISPPNGPVSGGTEVTVTGTGFTGATIAIFGHVRAKAVTVESDTRLTAVSPEHIAAEADITVGTPSGMSDIVQGARFTFRAPVAGSWERVQDCPSACHGPAVRLHDGRVLTVGGGDGDPPSKDALLFDPDSGKWRSTAPLARPRTSPLATVLGDGRVLVTGGRDAQGAVILASELYDPRTGKWQPTGSAIEWGFRDPLLLGTATLLKTGKVLLTTDSRKTQLFDPATGKWSEGASMSVEHNQSPATPLPNGNVLVEGGQSAGPGAQPDSLVGELYDPIANTWQPTGPLGVPHFRHRAVALGDGQVLVLAGNNGGFPFTEVFNPAIEAWRPAAPMNSNRDVTSSLDLLPDGKALVVGGIPGEGPTTSTELYDPAKDSWTLATPLPVARLDDHITVVLSKPGCGSACGKVLLFGSRRTKATYLYTPPAGPANVGTGSSGGPPVVLLGVIGLLVGISAGILLAGWLAARRRRQGAEPETRATPVDALELPDEHEHAPSH